MAEMDEIQEMFFDECGELLEGLANGLRQMDQPGYDKETVHAVFRAVHSIKGGAAAFGLNDLVTFAHRFETVLDLLRSDRLEADPALMSIMHRSSDCLADLVTAARQSSEPDHAKREALLTELDRIMADGGDDDAIEFTPMVIDIGALDGEDPLPGLAGEAGFNIHFIPDGDLYRSGNEPAALFLALAKLGEAEIRVDSDFVPPLSDWSEDQPQLRWTIILHTNCAADEIAEIFEFVEDCCELHVTPLTAEPDGPPKPDEISDSSPGDIPETAQINPPEPAQTDSARPSRPAASGGDSGATIRVSLARVDRLMNMIGELVIKEAMLAQVIQTAGMSEDPDVLAGLDAIGQLAGDIQESVMAIRAQPLKLVFQRMHRIVREAADATGKQVNLVTVGEETEVDKTMIERLIDPLTHMIRNSVDHGLEDGETRQARGKPAEGRITLSAAHRSGRVQIEVSDDGGGINRPKVREIAEERGLVASGASLNPAEIDQLLFMPGFSSKTEVSALSGRGVGLDVVRREIMDLGGRVMIHSEIGQGTTFSIALPLTLAVLEGMLIQLCGETMVLPINAVQETMRANPSMLHGVGQDGRLLSNRGDLIPIIDLAGEFGLRDCPATIEGGVLIVIEADNQKRSALLVDGIIDQRQVVIKSLEENYGHVPGVSAATILGDGKIALIIDPEEVVRTSSGDHDRAVPAAAAQG
ncbi:chemotaxis protein CheA [Paracoccus onubensis]|uniref:Chemotaxis protein CheA n=1 Tax=Paracoccus onubensis TaxID=1675788 RepID=A0A418SQY5_9RHOB|nr:chemotaxis protein CheA [Paracoccus onubensis]RJE83374.1 chemotaxis protein CheA [Paracoccus onubensis]